MIVRTPEPPYYAVIFTSLRTTEERDYAETNAVLLRIASGIEGFLGEESARSGLGVAVSYWASLEAIQEWRTQMDHVAAKARGRATWYTRYAVRICKVEWDRVWEETER